MGTLIAAMGIVFLAELGDKTQLVALGLGARHRLGPVLVGMTLGYAATNLLSVVVGGLLGAALPTRPLGIGGGLLFLAFAAWTLRADDEEDDDDASTATSVSWLRVVASVAGTMFVAELGDKTMLATATLAAQGNPLLVWIGATLGITASGAVGVFVGRSMGTRLPERVTRLGSAALFAAFGVVLIATNL
ncbi:TMEM165/GDT1 family protein [Actinospongicola halichondriae]|uniref:TMEM165/GDT1 family protein n=1 Tax=Actinospongicola halichondriae TaxID=3236844 RepID=UPI003D49BCF4